MRRMKPFGEGLFEIPELLFRISGIARWGKQSFQPFIIGIYAGTLVLLIFSSGIALAQRQSQSMNTEPVIVIMSGTIFLANYLVVAGRRERVVRLMEDIENLLEEIMRRKSLRPTIEDSHRVCSCAARILLINLFLTLFVASVRSIYTFHFTDTPVYIFDYWSPFYSFYPNLVYQVVMVLTCLVTSVTVSISKISFSLYISSVMTTIQSRMKIMKSDKDIRDIYASHFRVINYCSELNNALGLTNFVEFILSTGAIGFCALKLTKATNDELLKLIGMLISTLVNPFVICLCGTAISSENDKILTAMHENEWFKLSLKEQKSLTFIALNATKPVGLHYRRFLFFDMQAFLQLIKWVYSFVAVLQTVDIYS